MTDTTTTTTEKDATSFAFAISYDWRDSQREDFPVLEDDTTTEKEGAVEAEIQNQRAMPDESLEEWSGGSKWGSFDDSFDKEDWEDLRPKNRPPPRHSTSLASPRIVGSKMLSQQSPQKLSGKERNAGNLLENQKQSKNSRLNSPRMKWPEDSKRIITSASLSPRGIRKYANGKNDIRLKNSQSTARRNVVSGSFDKWLENSAWDGLDLQFVADKCTPSAESGRRRNPTSPRLRGKKYSEDSPSTPRSYEVPSKASEAAGECKNSLDTSRSRRRTGSSTSRSLSPKSRSLQSSKLNSPTSVADDISIQSQPVSSYGLDGYYDDKTNRIRRRRVKAPTSRSLSPLRSLKSTDTDQRRGRSDDGSMKSKPSSPRVKSKSKRSCAESSDAGKTCKVDKSYSNGNGRQHRSGTRRRRSRTRQGASRSLSPTMKIGQRKRNSGGNSLRAQSEHCSGDNRRSLSASSWHTSRSLSPNTRLARTIRTETRQRALDDQSIRSSPAASNIILSKSEHRSRTGRGTESAVIDIHMRIRIDDPTEIDKYLCKKRRSLTYTSRSLSPSRLRVKRNSTGTSSPSRIQKDPLRRRRKSFGDIGDIASAEVASGTLKLDEPPTIKKRGRKKKSSGTGDGTSASRSLTPRQRSRKAPQTSIDTKASDQPIAVAV